LASGLCAKLNSNVTLSGKTYAQGGTSLLLVSEIR
jgi:hypothetical protein